MVMGWCADLEEGSDPGITINIYYPKPETYTIPGPEIFTCDW